MKEDQKVNLICHKIKIETYTKQMNTLSQQKAQEIIYKLKK